MKATQQQAAEVEAKATKLAAAHAPAIAANLALVNPMASHWQQLQQAEQTVKKLMGSPGHAAAVQLTGHEMEWGLVLHMFNNPEDFGLPGTVKILLKTAGMPDSTITPEELQAWLVSLGNGGIITGEGAIVRDSQWNVLDPGWALAFLGYLLHRLHIEPTASFGAEPQTVALDGTQNVTIGIVGDWGTGPWTDGADVCPSEAVIDVLRNTVQPHVLIHLGDTYYAGTEKEVTDHLLDPIGNWPLAFALNGNHEMYDGANGYFKVALAGSAFAAQKGTSYFALTYNNIVILGLDTSYYDTSFLYMDGALTDAGQLDFLKQLDLAGKTVVVLTHHNPLYLTGEKWNTTDSSTGKGVLWEQVSQALGGKAPDYWYWGHIHVGVAYNDKSIAGTGTKARCAGHGALPFANAPLLSQLTGPNAPYDYYAHTPLANPDSQQQDRVLNGFATIELKTDGTIVETFYDQLGSVAWQTPQAVAKMLVEVVSEEDEADLSPV